MNVVVLGAGGHALVVAEAVLAPGGALSVVGFLDDDPRLYQSRVLDLPVLGPISSLRSIDHDAVVIGIGDNVTRTRLFLQLSEAGEHVISVTHPEARVSLSAVIGNGTLITAGTVITSQAYIGENVIVNTGATVDHNCVVESHAHVAPGVHLAGGCTVGIGSLIGIGSVVIPSRRIGAWSIVGAGSVVVRDVPDGVVAYGNPARVRRQLATPGVAEKEWFSAGFRAPAGARL